MDDNEMIDSRYKDTPSSLNILRNQSGPVNIYLFKSHWVHIIEMNIGSWGRKAIRGR